MMYVQSGQFEKLYEQYGSRVYAYFSSCFGGDSAEDCTQQTFLKIWKAMNRPGFFPPYRWNAWIFRIAVNVKNDHLREKLKRGETVSLLESDDPSDDGSEKRLLEQEAVSEALFALKEEDREILIFKYNGLKSAEIGRILGLSSSAARSRIAAAKERFRESLKKRGVDPDE